MCTLSLILPVWFVPIVLLSALLETHALLIKCSATHILLSHHCRVLWPSKLIPSRLWRFPRIAVGTIKFPRNIRLVLPSRSKLVPCKEQCRISSEFPHNSFLARSAWLRRLGAVELPPLC